MSGRARYVYRSRPDGSVRAILTADIPFKGTPDSEVGSFHQRVLNAYRQQECDGKFQGPYAKSTVKRVHEAAIARGE